MVQEIFLHCGYPKTGTTSIQAGLYKYQNIIKKKGVEYSFHSILDKNGKHHLASLIRRKPRYRNPTYSKWRLRRELKHARGNIAMISDETLSLLSAPLLKELSELLDGWIIRPIFYLRRQDLFLQSLWSQAIKTGNTWIGFDEWVDLYLTDDPEAFPSMYDPNYLRVLGHWAQQFGKENIIVRPFESSQLQINVFQDIIKVIGFPNDETLHYSQHVNISPSLKTLEVIRYIGKLLFDNSNIAQGHRGQLLNTLRITADEMGWNNIRLNLISAEMHNKIMKFYGPINQEVAQIYLDTNNLFLDPFIPQPISEFQLDETQKDLLNYLDKVVVNMVTKNKVKDE